MASVLPSRTSHWRTNDMVPPDASASSNARNAGSQLVRRDDNSRRKMQNVRGDSSAVPGSPSECEARSYCPGGPMRTLLNRAWPKPEPSFGSNPNIPA